MVNFKLSKHDLLGHPVQKMKNNARRKPNLEVLRSMKDCNIYKPFIQSFNF